MSAEFRVIEVSDQRHEWQHAKGGTNVDYWIGIVDNSGTDMKVLHTRKIGSDPPAVGETIYGHTEPKTSKKSGKEYLKLVRDQREDGGYTYGGKKADTRDAAWFFAKDRRISRAGILQAVVASGIYNEYAKEEHYVRSVNNLTDLLLDSLDDLTPHPEDMTTENWDFTE